MKKKVKLLSMALALIMIVSMLTTFSVSAETEVTYANTKYGSLIYSADFRGTSGIWENPTQGWDGMTAVVAEDGSSVTLTPNDSLDKKGRSCWGSTLNTTNFKAAGSSYTFTFTLEASDNNQFIGFYPDWGTGFIIWPGAKKVSVGQWGNATKVAGNKTYEGDETTAQTYAVEIGVSNELVEGFYKCTTYKLLVLVNNEWKLLYDLNETQRGKMQWTETDFEMVLRFVRLGGYANQKDGSVTVSKLNIYKGLTLEYYAASEGDVLYTADFRGTKDMWTPANGTNKSYDTMQATVSEDGKSVVLVSPEKDNGKGRAVWGGELNTSIYKAPGCSYTFEFTVEAEDKEQEIGFYPDWGTGFIVCPGQNRFRFGQWGNQTKVHATDYYLGSGELKQTYAVEFSVSGTEKVKDAEQKDTDFYKVLEYSLYVKNGDTWTHVYSLSSEAECNSIAGTKELDSLQWTATDCEVVLRFFRSPGGTQLKNVTVSDAILKKGLAIKSTIAEKQPLTGGNIDYASKEDGELLYKVNFNGDENYTPAKIADGVSVLNAAVDTTDNGKVTLNVPTAQNGLFNYWGGEIKNLPLNDENQYTIVIEVQRDKETSTEDPKIGFSVDGKYYVVGNSSYVQITKWGVGKVRSAVKYSDNALYSVIGNHELDYGETTAPFTQTIVIEIDCANMNRAIRTYALTDDGSYVLFSNSDGGSNIQFMNDNLSFYCFQQNADQPITINSVNIYKGRNVEAWNAALEEEETTESTEEATEEATEVGTEAATKEEAKTEAGTNAPVVNEKKGCKSMIASSYMFMAIVAIFAVAFFFKKKVSEE